MVGGTGRAERIHGKRRFHDVNLDHKARADDRGGPSFKDLHLCAIRKSGLSNSERASIRNTITLIKDAEKNVDCRATGRK
jgi:hypothetical protein